MRIAYVALTVGALTVVPHIAAQPASGDTIITTNRPDGRFVSTLGSVRSWMKTKAPRLQYKDASSGGELAAWRDSVADAMARIMKHPSAPAAEAKKVKTVQRDGYRVERWETYPIEGAVVPILALIPDGTDEKNPAKGAALCIPGFAQTKEMLAGENHGDYNLDCDTLPVPGRSAQALMLVKEGLVTVAVDNPSFGELSDNGRADYLLTSRWLLEGGWSYLGYTSWCDRVALQWLKERNDIPKDRVIVSGFSLGTEPLMVLGALDESIYAFVYNDFMCRTRERAFVMTVPDADNRRTFPNSIEHLIPEFLTEFDFPDLVCALAPRPVILTEGGMDRDFDIIRKAYEKAGAPENVEIHHYAKYADQADRVPLDTMPEGVDLATYFRLANVDPPNHYYKAEWVLPWLRKILK